MTIDEAIASVQEFERHNPGRRYGMDFPQIADLIALSEKFKNLAVAHGLIALLCAATFKPADQKEPVEQIRNSPIWEMLMVMFYAGIVFGRAEIEAKKLEELVR